MKNLFSPILKSDMFSHFISLKYLPRWLVLTFDTIICFISYVLSIYIAKKLNTSEVLSLPIVFRFTILIFFQIFFFWLFHTYSGILRYSGYVDAAKLLFAVFSNGIVLIIINIIADYGFGYPIFYYISILFYSVLSFFFLFLLRLTVKTAHDIISANGVISIPVMIYGTKSSGTSIAKMIRTSEEVKYKLVGFIDTEKDVTSKVLMGVKVYDLTEETAKKTISKKAKAVIVSPLKMETINPKTDLDIFINNGMSVLIVPSMSVWDGDAPSVRQIKSVQIEDLLERPQINISTENISKEIRDKVILITGAAGSIGSEIVKQTISFSPKLIVMVDQAETPMHDMILKMKEKYPKTNFSAFLGDVRNRERMNLMMNTYRPDVVFHAAAYKHVPLMEDNPTECIQTNVMGTKNMADLSVMYNVSRFVMVSTDKAVIPTNVMGASKRIAEIYVQSFHKKMAKENENSTKFITTRFGNVLGSSGSVIPYFKHQIEIGGPVTVTHPDIIRYFMTIPEACLLVLEAGITGNGGEIYIFDMGEPIKIVDLAKKMIRLAGFVPEVDIPIIFTGLRPGEKLYEELLNQKEKTKETHHPKIMIAEVREYDYEDVSKKTDELIRCSFLGKNYLTVSQMKRIVPEFISNNSQYEKLDIENMIN